MSISSKVFSWAEARERIKLRTRETGTGLGEKILPEIKGWITDFNLLGVEWVKTGEKVFCWLWKRWMFSGGGGRYLKL